MVAPAHQPPPDDDDPTPKPREFTVVRISLAALGASSSGELGSLKPDDQTRIVFDVSVKGDAVARLEAAASEVGLPLNLAQARRSQADEKLFKIPDYILAALQRVVPYQQWPRGWPLWVSFPRYSGYLPMLPWEALLQRRLKVPILRLSYTEVQPIRSRQALDVATCFSFPRAKQVLSDNPSANQSPQDIVRYFFQRLPKNLAPYTTFHVFADQDLYLTLQTLRDQNPQFRIVVYDPAGAARYAVPGVDTSLSTKALETIESPWLLWMRNALGQTSVDLAHFIGHGYLGKEEGVLAVSHSPLLNDDEQWSRFIGARQLCTFLDQVGAWSVAFSSPPNNASVSGLRLLQDQMARVRPGPVLFHDIGRDPTRSGWDAAFQYAYAIELVEAPTSNAISLCCNPDWALPGSAPDTATKRLVKELTVAGRMPDVFEGAANTPSWLASSQRSLEKSVAQLIDVSPDTEQARKGGTAQALRFSAELLQRHAAHLVNLSKKS